MEAVGTDRVTRCELPGFPHCRSLPFSPNIWSRSGRERHRGYQKWLADADRCDAANGVQTLAHKRFDRYPNATDRITRIALRLRRHRVTNTQIDRREQEGMLPVPAFCRLIYRPQIRQRKRQPKKNDRIQQETVPAARNVPMIAR